MTWGWKLEKGSLKWKWENLWRLMGGANRRMKRKRLDSTRSIYKVLNPSKIKKSWTFYSRVSSPNFWVYHGRSWRLSNCHIQRLEKMNLFKMLDFQRICFSRKRPWTRHPFCSTKKEKSFEPNHQISS